MVKKQRKPYVWEQQKVKQPRKRRTNKSKQDQEVVGDFELGEIEEKQNNESINLQIEDKGNQMMDIEQQAKQQKDKVIPIPQKQDKQLEQQQLKKRYDQKLAMIRSILDNGIDKNQNALICQENSTTSIRQFQCSQILSFLNKQCNKFEDGSSLLYVYGTPGTGKTFTIKNLLNLHGFMHRTKWINCLTMLNKSLLRYRIPFQENQQRKSIFVIDEFDQMQKQYKNKRFIKSFKVYIKQIINKSFVQNLSNIKFIFISNKSYESISLHFKESVLNLIKAVKITQIPFLPYNPQDIMKIFNKKLELIQQKLGQKSLSSLFVEIATKKQYLKSQDIRQMSNFIYQNIQMQETEKLKPKMIISEKERFTTEKNSPLKEFITGLTGNQKILFKKMLQLSSKAEEEEQELLQNKIYKEADKLNISKHNTDVWLKEWMQMGMISLKRSQTGSMGFFELKAIISKVSYKECINDFY